jgi:hypothetical protein
MTAPEAGSVILDELEVMLARYIAFPDEHSRAAVVLWIVHAHAIDAFESTPRLALLSPEKGSGKTRTLEVLALLVPRPVHAVNMSAAALYRIVKDKQPTLLLDEADTYLGLVIAKQHEDLRGLINAGHRRGATVYRGEIAGKGVQVVEFPAYAACALAGIGDLPDTILDRSVIVSMKRRASHEQVEPFRERLARPAAESLRDRIAEWADAHHGQLEDHWPDLPEGITDRAADVWEALLAVADFAGGEWPERGRAAAVAITKAKSERDPSLGVQLLGDCRRLFTEKDIDRFSTEQLVQALVDLSESPWGDLRGKPIDARGLARRLRKYDIRPGNHRFGDVILKGYRLEDFHDALDRYLPVAPVADVAHPATHTRAGNGVADGLFNLNGVLPSISEDIGTSVPREGQQALHPQQTTDSSANGNGKQNGHHQTEDPRNTWLDGLETTIVAEADESA